jgi:hypothetical protein
MSRLRRIIFLPPAALIVIGTMLLSAPSAAQQFSASSVMNYIGANHERAAQASFVRHHARLIAHVYADRAEAKQDRKQRREAAQDAAQAAAAAAAAAAAQATATPTPQPTVGGSTTVSVTGVSAFEACVITRESGGNPQAVNPSSGAGGLFQFLPSTWAGLGMGYPGGAQTAPVSVQYAAFNKLYAEAGTAPWASDGC